MNVIRLRSIDLFEFRNRHKREISKERAECQEKALSKAAGAAPIVERACYFEGLMGLPWTIQN